MSPYDIMYEAINDKYENGVITFEQANELNELAYVRYVIEKETDHPAHIEYKRQASERTGKDLSNLPNKKYIKNPEKADLIYKGREKTADPTIRPVDNDPEKKGHGLIHGFNAISSHKMKDASKDKAVKALAYMKKHCNFKNEKEARNYKTAFRIFCNKFNIPENSSLWVKYYPPEKINFEGREFIHKGEIKVGHHVDREELKLDDKEKPKSKNILKKLTERKVNIPKGYSLVHGTDKNGLFNLKPTAYSSKFNGAGPAGLGGQYRAEKRVYMTLVKDSDAKSYDSYGKHVYALNEPVKSVWVDTECFPINTKETELNLKNLVGKPVYIKTDTPLNVKKIK